MRKARFEGKTAVVTGGGSGIGRSIAIGFAGEGARAVILDLSEEKVSGTLETIAAGSGAAAFHACDVSSRAAVRGVFNAIREDHGKIDILVNNAGIAHVGNLENTSEEDLDRIYAVNVKGVYNCMRAAIEGMRKEGGGVILNVASITSKIGILDRFAYSMSKGAVMTMTFSVARDYVDHNIRCNCICPARVHTPFVDGFLKENYPDRVEEMFAVLSRYQPIGRMAEPEEIAALVLYLCSEEAAFITGGAYDIDGGVMNLR